MPCASNDRRGFLIGQDPEDLHAACNDPLPQHLWGSPEAVITIHRDPGHHCPVPCSVLLHNRLVIDRIGIRTLAPDLIVVHVPDDTAFPDPDVNGKRDLRQMPAGTKLKRSDPGLYLPIWEAFALLRIDPHTDRDLCFDIHVERIQLSVSYLQELIPDHETSPP